MPFLTVWALFRAASQLHEEKEPETKTEGNGFHGKD
jgi:hypothetical protein